ncbi:DUF2512 family protein [Alkalibacterium sp. MB6]|uniref:DUF2512 family protein n=1 Tax=Alkalibacterium sp. MB6 TaxID=2081965 RepID=UPI00137A31A1|nr:DUF2512 family protein [Alkalibacterium sp. MB6]
MNHVKAIAIKLVAHLVLGWVVLSLIFEAPAGDALIAAAIVAILIYVVGDLLVLRKAGNIPATLLDAGTAFLVTWLYLNSMNDGDFLVASFVFAIGVGLFEYFFHNWLLGNVIPDERRVH